MSIHLKVNALLFLIIAAQIVEAQSDGKGTCQNPYIIKDTTISLVIENNHNDKVWFVFKAPSSSFNISVYDNEFLPYNYLIFKYTGEDFCEAINAKSLISERNKVCDKTIAADISENLSYENINRGVCNCDNCCFTHTSFKARPGQTYYMVVYNPNKHMNVGLEKSSEFIRRETEGESYVNPFDIEKLEVGQAIVLENIYFHGGTANILRASIPTLNDLYDFLDSHKSVRVSIQGHVNAPWDSPDINHSGNLAGRRAKAVHDHLVRRGIKAERLAFEGFGNTRMVYPEAKTEGEMARNRRVEIIIISK